MALNNLRSKAMRVSAMRGLRPLGVGVLLAIATLATAADRSHVAPAVALPAIEASVPVAVASTPPLPLLWKVSDDDNAIYLLGSFHLLKPGDYPLSPDIDAAFDTADRVVFEVTPEQLADPANSQRFLAAAGYGDERTLSTVLSAGLSTKLDALMGSRGGSIALLDGYEPWFVNLSLVLGLAQSMGFSADHGLDRHLMTRAAAAGKPTAGLESMEVQLRALDASPMSEQIVGLADFLDRPDEMPAMIDDLHQAWRTADIARLDAMTRAEMRERTPETYRVVNVERNDAWMPKLRAMLDDDSVDTLVVVGALHLLGDDGVIERLRTAGLQVERICSACDAAPVAVH